MMKEMRKTVMMILVLALFPLSACHEPVVGPEVSGKAVSFTARTGLGNLTKTEYKNVVYNGIELMEWKDKDPIRVASPEAKVYDMSKTPWELKVGGVSNPTAWSDADYLIVGSTISNHSNESISEAKVENPTPTSSGLQWGDDVFAGTYHFYGIYPGQGKKDISFTSVTASPSQAVIAASLPADQTKSGNSAGAPVTSKPDSLVLPPDMEFAYMRAYAAVPWNGSGAAPDLPLGFYPMITTFQVTVGGDPDNTQDELTLSRVELVSASCRLAGAWTTTVTGDTRSSVSYVSEALATGKQDTVRLYMPTGSAPIISRTKQLTFTFFVLPKGVAYDSTLQSDKQNGVTNNDTAITDLSLRFQVSGKFGGTSTVTKWLSLPLKIKDNYTPTATDKLNINARRYVEFPAGRKINIKNITLPLQLNPWTFSVSATDLEEEISDVAVSPVQVQSWESVDPEDPLDLKLFQVTHNGVTTVSKGTAVDGGTVSLSDYSAVSGGYYQPTTRFVVTTAMGYDVEISNVAAAEVTQNPSLEPSTGEQTKTVYFNWKQNYDYALPASNSNYVEKAFSVSASQKVYFSSGNLQYRASSDSWRFAENQYDFVGNADYGTVWHEESGVSAKSNNLMISQTYAGWIDLFGWGTSGYNGWAAGTYGSARFPWSTDETSTNYGPAALADDLTGTFANGDWGVYNAAKLPSAGSGTWRTLTAAEWLYLLEGEGRSGYRYLFGYLPRGTSREFVVTFRAKEDPRYSVSYTVSQPAPRLGGLIVFPDNFAGDNASLVSSAAFQAYAGSINTGTVVSEVTNWAELEAAGCVFLPGASSRLGNREVTIVHPENFVGEYWSSTNDYNSGNAYKLYFLYNGQFYVYSHDDQYERSKSLCNRGHAVRLVRDLPLSDPSAGTSSYVIGGNPF